MNLNCNSIGRKPKVIKINEVNIDRVRDIFSIIESIKRMIPAAISKSSMVKMLASIFGRKEIIPKLCRRFSKPNRKNEVPRIMFVIVLEFILFHLFVLIVKDVFKVYADSLHL